MTRKTLTLVVVALGIIYIALAANFLHQYREVARILAYYGVSEAEIKDFEPIASTRTALLAGSIVCACLGIATLFAGAGLFLAKEWGRKLWLAIATLLPVLHLFRLVADHSLGTFWIAERAIELVAVSLLAFISWRLFAHSKSVPAATAT